MSLGVPRELTEPTKKKNKKLNMHNRMNNTFIKGKTTSKGLKKKWNIIITKTIILS